jgi:hypothetical protein
MSATYPTLDLTWQESVTSVAAQGTALACSQVLLLTIVNALLGFASAPPQVRGSSNSVSASLLAQSATGPGTNYWSLSTNLVWAANGTAHSWIVLRQAGWGNGTYPEVLISCVSGSSTLTVRVSPSAGFAGGSATTDPTATDSQTLGSNASWGVTGSNQAYVASVWQDTTGKCTRIGIGTATATSGYIAWETAKNPVSGWTNPIVFGMIGTNSGANQLTSNGFWHNIGPWQTVVNGSLVSLWWTSESCQPSVTLITTGLLAPNDLSGSYPAAPIGLFVVTAGSGASSVGRGRIGMFYDLWWGTSSVTNASPYAGATAHQYVQFGECIFPNPLGTAYPGGPSTDLTLYGTYGLGTSNGGKGSNYGQLTTSSNPLGAAKLSAAVTYWYQMVCCDAVSSATASWLVQGAPDPTATTVAALAAIANAGLATPVRFVRIAASWPSPN